MSTMISYIKIWALAVTSVIIVSCMGVNEEDLAGNFFPPEVSVSDITLSKETVSISLNGSYKLSSASTKVAECGFYYSLDSEYATSFKVVADNNSEDYSACFIPEYFDKEYFYKSYISNGKAELTSVSKSFKMPKFEYFTDLGVPVVMWTNGTDVNIEASLVVAEGIDVSEIGIVYSTEENVTIENNKAISANVESISVEIKGLVTGQKYYMRSYVRSDNNIAYSNEIEYVPHSVPSLSTAPVTDITYTSAISGGIDLIDNGLDISSKGIVWSTNPNPSVDVTTKTIDGDGNTEYKSSISNLTPGTKYYVRAYAINSDGVGYGNEITFETLALRNATISTADPSDITGTSAISGGNITDDGGAEITDRGVVWSTSNNPTIDLTTKVSSGKGTGEFICNINDLEPGTTYYVRAYAINSQGASYGEEKTFTTKKILATLTTAEASQVTTSSAIVGGNITSSGGAEITERGVVWSIKSTPTVDDNKVSSGVGVGEFTITLNDLSIATTYYVRAYAINSVGVSYGNQISFTTGTTKATISTIKPTDVTSSSARSGGNVISDGGTEVTARGVVWSTFSMPTIENSNKTNDGSGIGIFDSQISALNPGTTYYVRAYATNINGTSYGEEFSFTTDIVLPTVKTTVPKDITNDTAIVGGSVISTGGAEVSERGIVWSISNNPTTADNKIPVGFGLGDFSTELAHLERGTTYYVRAYATNPAGTSYGEEKSFTTKSLLANVEPHISVESYSSLMVNVFVENPDNENVVFGIVYNNTGSPNMSDKTYQSHGSTMSGPCWINDLVIGKTYYIRAYVSNLTNGECVLNNNVVVYTHSVPDISVKANETVTLSATSAKCSAVLSYEEYYTANSVNVSIDFNPVVSCGFVYSTESAPTLNSSNVTNEGSQTSYTSSITDLKPNTKYYVRPYATTKTGTFYGNEISFITKKLDGDTEDVGNEDFEW